MKEVKQQYFDIDSAIDDFEETSKEIGSVEYQIEEIENNIWIAIQNDQDYADDNTVLNYLKSKLGELENMQSDIKSSIYSKFGDFYE